MIDYTLYGLDNYSPSGRIATPTVVRSAYTTPFDHDDWREQFTWTCFCCIWSDIGGAL